MSDVINILNVILVVAIFAIFALGIAYFYINQRSKNKTKEEIKAAEKGSKNKDYVSPIQGNLSKESIYKFMEFDEIKDNMIIRKNREQYVMVIQCQGVNYDLLSEQEKIAVEEGFVQFLNTLRFQVQLYVQTRSLNLKEIIEGYKDRVKKLEQEVEQIRNKIRVAANSGNLAALEKLKYEERRKVNILEYGADISEYISRMSLNKNVLQQKTYIIISYYTNELGNVSNYSKTEIDNMCFSELYTRSQSVIRSLASCEVTGRILNSEELAELLYIAYNRDDAELLQLSKALDAEYDALYSTAKDVLRKKEEIIEKQLDEEAVELATKSIMTVDEQMEQERLEKAKREKKVKQKALKLVNQYKDQLEGEVYERVVEEVTGNKRKVEEDEFEEEIEEAIEEAKEIEKMKEEQEKSKRKRRTKKEMEEARKLEAQKAEPPKKRGRKKKTEE